MATTTPTLPAFTPGPTPAAGSPAPFRLNVAQYDAMIEAGILTEDHKVELVGGVLFRKMPKKGPHSIASRETFKVLDRLMPSGYFVTWEDPVRIPDYDEPEPDISIVRGQSRDYSIQPDASRVALVVEVSDATLAYDRGEKERSSWPTLWGAFRLLDRQPGGGNPSGVGTARSLHRAIGPG